MNIETQTESNQDTLSRRIVRWLLFSALFAKQFYILPSGSFQLGDMLMLLSFLVLFIHLGGQFRIERVDFLLIAFVLSVCAINLLHFSTLGDSSFLTYSLYYVFAIIGVLLFRYVAKDIQAIRGIRIVFRCALVFQLIVFLLGFGRQYGVSRYMGTFNDPNQFAVYIFFAFLAIKLVGMKLQDGDKIIDDVLVIVLGLLSVSTGFLVALASYYLLKLLHLFTVKNFSVRSMLSRALVPVVGIVAITALFVNATQISNMLLDIPAFERLVEKISKILYGATYAGTSDLFGDRALDRIFYYPEYFIYGAGEGGWLRFSGVGRLGEMHSTWIGLAFYYGLVPFVLLVIWVVRNTCDFVRSGGWVIFIPFLVETMFLANQRQPSFWMLLVLMSAVVPVVTNLSDHVTDNALVTLVSSAQLHQRQVLQRRLKPEKCMMRGADPNRKLKPHEETTVRHDFQAFRQPGIE